MVRWLVCAACFITACTSATQPAGTTPSQPGDRAVVKQLFELTGKREQYTLLLRDRLDELQRVKPQQANVLREFFRRYLSWEAVEDELTDAYLSTYSTRELADMVVFFGTPVGKKVSDFQPVFLNAIAQMAVRRVQAHASDLFKMGIVKALGQDPDEGLTSAEAESEARPRPFMSPHQKAAMRVLRAAKFDTGYQAGLEAELDERAGDDPERAALLREFYHRYLGWEAMKDEVVQLYMDTFTEPELGALATFYESSTGQQVVQTEALLADRTKTIMIHRFTVHADALFALWKAENEPRPVAPANEL